MSQHLHIDPFAGVAGDMFLGACVDLGAPLDAIAAALEPLPMAESWELTTRRVTRHNLTAIDLRVELHEHEQAGHHAHSDDAGASRVRHRHAHYRDIAGMVDRLDAPDRARRRAENILRLLGEAEAAVHDIALDDVHFHEVGAVDSIVDMFGAAVAVELLGVETATCGALPLGRGFVKCAHGTMPLPAPATARVLTGVPTVGVDREVETVTPTGAAIVVALAEEFGPQPAMDVAAVGYGAGDRDDPDVPNLLRLFLGRRH